MFHPIRRALALSIASLALLFTSSKAEVGIGANLGAPTALDIRVGQQKTLEGMVGWSLHENGNTHLEMVGNILFHGPSLGHESPISGIFPYAGVGLGFWSDGKQGVWLQVPLGIDLRFSVPIEVGIHVDPGMDLMPETQVTVHWGLGIRYWFK